MALLGTLRTQATLENLHLLTDFVHSVGRHLELDDSTPTQKASPDRWSSAQS
jgi:hypothetical protein